jgi:Arc/MetJ-type ribon-helix-helix transcriptional regulator
MIKSNSDTQPVDIRSEFVQQIEEIVEQSYQFGSVSEYVNFLLKAFLDTDGPAIEREQTELEQRLKDLGYL